jgi:pSer/pThr/pTyr-binding forkhead associated (FHA) protein
VTSRLGVPVLSLIHPSATGGVAIHPLKEGTTTLGRASDNDLVLGDASVADHHAVLIRDRERLVLRDLLSGKTFVNDAPSKGGEIRPGDVIRLGEVRVRVAYSASGSGSHPALQPRPSSTDKRPSDEGPTSDSGSRLARERDARRAKALARTRQLSDEAVLETDVEDLLKRIAVGFIEVFDADRGVCLLLEEDGRNPLLTVEKRKDGSEEGTGVAREIIDTCLRARTVVRIPPPGGDKRSPGGGFAAPLIADGKAIGLLFFEREERGGPFEADDVHLMALITNQTAFAVAKLLAES